MATFQAVTGVVVVQDLIDQNDAADIFATNELILSVDTTGGVATITLPTITDALSKVRIKIDDAQGNAAGNNITINGPINGAATLVINANNDSRIFEVVNFPPTAEWRAY